MKLSKNNKIVYFIISIAVTTLLDIYISNYISENIEIFNSTIFSNIINFTYYENTGAAFSILQNSTLLLIAIAILAIFALIILIIKKIESLKTMDCFITALLISGIACNTYERLTLGYVRDYFQLKSINFPVFNISDILINISVLAIIILVIKYNKKKQDNE